MKIADRIGVGDRVFIFETVTGKEFGERATVMEVLDGDLYHVRGADGALFSGTAENVRLMSKMGKPSELSDQIIALLDASGINDYDQRSAIGMARSFVDGHELKLAANSLDLKPKRDQLAKDIVALLEENPADEAEHVAALLKAREHVNAPYQVETHSGQRLGKPGEKRKAREEAKA